MCSIYNTSLLMDNCTLDCIQMMGNFSSSQTCSYVQNNCIQDTIQIVQAYYCLANASFIMLIIASLVLLVVIYYSLNIATDNYLAPCLEEFIVRLDMSEALAGITFLALANGAPDVVTAIVAGTSDSDSTVLIPFGSLYGAALFSMAFILSMVISFSPSQILSLNMRQTLVPLAFYLIGTLYIVVVSFFYQKMNVYIAVAFLSLYLIYIVIVIYEEYRKKQRGKERIQSLITESEGSQGFQEKKKLKKSIGDQVDQVYEEIQEAEEKEVEAKKDSLLGAIIRYVRIFWIFLFDYTIPLILKDNVNFKKLTVSLIVSPAIFWLSDGVPDVFSDTLLGVPQAIWFSIPSAILLVYLIINMVRGTKPYFTTIFNIYSFVVIVVWITIIVAVLVNFMQLFQILTNINAVFLGLTVFAWAASIGDYLSITTFAKRNLSSTAVSGIFSGQLFNFLIGFGVACLINSITDGQYDFKLFQLTGDTYQKLSDFIVVAVIGMAFLYMIYLFLVVIFRKGKLTKSQGRLSKIFYFGFVTVALVLSVLTDFFREISCEL